MMVKVPTSFDDFEPDDPYIHFRKQRWNYWGTLKDIRREWLETHSEFNLEDFMDHVKETYGIQPKTELGLLTDSYEIVDEQKYLIFLLKWK